MTGRRCVTALLMGDPMPDRLERAEALRQQLPEPRELNLSEWLERVPVEPMPAASA